MKAVVKLLAGEEVITTLHRGVIGIKEAMGLIRVYGTDEGNYVASYDRNDVLCYELKDVPDNEQWQRTIAIVTREGQTDNG